MHMPQDDLCAVSSVPYMAACAKCLGETDDILHMRALTCCDMREIRPYYGYGCGQSISIGYLATR